MAEQQRLQVLTEEYQKLQTGLSPHFSLTPHILTSPRSPRLH